VVPIVVMKRVISVDLELLAIGGQAESVEYPLGRVQEAAPWPELHAGDQLGRPRLKQLTHQEPAVAVRDRNLRETPAREPSTKLASLPATLAR
jgi:hypothetical protein